VKLAGEFEKIKKLSLKKLLVYVEKEFSIKIPSANGRLWAERKALYLALERYKGGLTGKALERYEALSTPQIIKQIQKEEAIRKGELRAFIITPIQKKMRRTK